MAEPVGSVEELNRATYDWWYGLIRDAVSAGIIDAINLPFDKWPKLTASPEEPRDG